MKPSEEVQLIRPDQKDTSADVIGEMADFVPSAPESLPRLTVPDLPADASGISAQDLAQVPTLTEQISAALPPEPAPEAPHDEPPALVTQVAPEPVPEPVPMMEAVDPLPDLPQGLPSHVESGLQQCQSRINQLTDEIQKLNDRLDQLDHRPKA
jgi:hypothetical protein